MNKLDAGRCCSNELRARIPQFFVDRSQTNQVGRMKLNNKYNGDHVDMSKLSESWKFKLFGQMFRADHTDPLRLKYVPTFQAQDEAPRSRASAEVLKGRYLEKNATKLILEAEWSWCADPKEIEMIEPITGAKMSETTIAWDGRICTIWVMFEV